MTKRPAIFESIVGNLLPLAYFLLAKVTPSGRVVAFISFPDVADNALAVYKEILRNENNRDTLAWLVADVRKAKQRLDVLVADGYSPIVVKKNSLRGLWLFLRAKYVFFTHGHYSFVRRIPGRRRLINLWHGMPLKAIGLLDGKQTAEVQASDLVVASSSFFAPLMADAFGLPADDVLITGLPRCDQLIGGASRQVLSLLEQLRGDCQRVVIWMPTYRFSIVGDVRSDSQSTRDAVVESFIVGMRKLSHLGAEWGSHIVAKLHPMDFLNDVDLPSFDNMTLVNAHSKVLEAVEIYDLLAGVDGLVTDVSSVCFDFMATKRPILITKDFVGDYTRALLFDPEELFAAAFTSVEWLGAEHFFSAVANGTKIDECVVKKFCEFNDDQSSARLLARVSDLCHQQKGPE